MEEVCSLRGHSDRVYSVAWSPNVEMLASWSHDQTVRLWSPSGETKGTLEGTVTTSWQHLDAETKALAAKVRKRGSSAGDKSTSGQYIVTSHINMVYVYVATSEEGKEGGPLACFRSPARVLTVVCRGTSVVARAARTDRFCFSRFPSLRD
mmetsp:Transcript_15592/g.37802  ORF Transcript_15592/g.37802 Transcript_15592/m.37802 type:complete len:151 (+) Transcript_15592:89-541(+)